MNIFYLSHEPEEAARWQCDQHVIKMTLESTQLLSTAHHILDGRSPIPYRPTHANHPCSLWVRASVENYEWLYFHALALASEYNQRFNKTHACQPMIETLATIPHNIPELGPTPVALAMPEEHKVPCPVTSYRSYYRTKSFARWKANRPEWF